jgi:indole-3-glycerol phosphate synthase
VASLKEIIDKIILRMDILEKIIAGKKNEVANAKLTHEISFYENQKGFHRTPYSLKKRLKEDKLPGIIAEYKKKSPSKGVINDSATPWETGKGYELAGVAGISVLTDKEFFAGDPKYLEEIRATVEIPILRKDFIIDEYQIIESKAIGADVVLLIAECLDKNELFHLTKMAHSLDMEVLLEIHTERQLDKIVELPDIIGVNNRDLTTFDVSIQHSLDLIDQLPATCARISESGISSVEAIATLNKVGFEGFLIGEFFMREKNPGIACQYFIQQLRDSL